MTWSATTTSCWTVAADCRRSGPASFWAIWRGADADRSRRVYPQRFGIPEGLYAEPVAVKQGWFCCWNGGNWLHVSTGVIGPDRRYVMAIGSLEPDGEAAARATITQAVKTMFPGGRI